MKHIEVTDELNDVTDDPMDTASKNLVPTSNEIIDLTGETADADVTEAKAFQTPRRRVVKKSDNLIDLTREPIDHDNEPLNVDAILKHANARGRRLHVLNSDSDDDDVSPPEDLQDLTFRNLTPEQVEAACVIVNATAPKPSLRRSRRTN